MNNGQLNMTASPIELLVFYALALVLLIGAAFYILRASKSKISIANDGENNSQNQVYKDQLEALKSSLESGAISQSEFAAGRIEIGARLLRAQKQNNEIKTDTETGGNRFIFIVVLIFGIAAAGLYYFVGSPNYKDLPYKAREKAILATSPENLSQDEIMVLLQNRAKEQPQDPVPHLLMGSILRGEGRADEALRAFQAALRRDPKNADALALLAMSMFDMNEQKTDSQIENAILASLQIDSKNMNAHFLNGQIAWASARREEAMDIWGKALALYDEKDPRHFGLISRIIDVISKLDKGPSENGAAPFANAKPEDMSAMIDGMIANRTLRLNQNPKDIGLRLSVARVNIMANKPDVARKILLDGHRYAETSIEKEILTQVLSMMGNAEKGNEKGSIEK